MLLRDHFYKVNHLKFPGVVRLIIFHSHSFSSLEYDFDTFTLRQNMEILVCFKNGMNKRVSSVTSHSALGVNPLWPFTDFIHTLEIIDIISNFDTSVVGESIDIILCDCASGATVGDIYWSVVAVIFVSLFDMKSLRLQS